MIEKGYSLMPNEILFDKELTDKQKLLYCLISSLCAKEGFCRASNKYFSEKLGTSETTISTNINILFKSGYINIEEGTNQKRKCLLKNQKQPFEKSKAEPFEKSKHNNIIYNNKINKIKTNIIKPKNDFSFYQFVEEFIDKENPQIRYQIEKQGDEYIEKQCVEIDKLLKDGYTLEIIQLVLLFIKQSDFRQKNILSIKKLREKDKNGIPYIVRMIDEIKKRKPERQNVAFIPSSRRTVGQPI